MDAPQTSRPYTMMPDLLAGTIYADLEDYLPFYYRRSKGYEILYDKIDQAPFWIRCKISKNSLLWDKQYKQKRLPGYHSDVNMPDDLRTVLRQFKVDYVFETEYKTELDEQLLFDFEVGHMLSSAEAGNSHEANSLANCTIENKTLNRGVGLEIEKEVLRIASYSSYVIVMKGKRVNVRRLAIGNVQEGLVTFKSVVIMNTKSDKRMCFIDGIYYCRTCPYYTTSMFKSRSHDIQWKNCSINPFGSKCRTLFSDSTNFKIHVLRDNCEDLNVM